MVLLTPKLLLAWACACACQLCDVAAASEVAAAPRIGIVTMHTPDIRNYANSTTAINRRYASRWGYGYHVLDHQIDKTRVPHWSKIHAVQIYLPEYDFLFWIDADAAFFDQSRRLEDVVGLDSKPEADIFAQDIWPDYPSLYRNELIDTGMVLFKNSRWTRQFLWEMYYYPACQEHLNWTEQYCFSVAYRDNLMGMRNRTAILPTPTLNHHILPPPDDPTSMFVLHLAGRPSRARTTHFMQLHDGRTEHYRQDAGYNGFWSFRHLFARNNFGGVATMQACLFGMGARHRYFLDGLLYHFPYMATFTIVRSGAPSLWSHLKASEPIAERFPMRVAHIDVNEYLSGKTRDGDKFVNGFFCDVVVVSVESSRHMPSVDILGRLARGGLEPPVGDKDTTFGYSPLRDIYFVWLMDGCTEAGGTASPAARLDGNDEDGSAMAQACNLLVRSRAYVEQAHKEAEANGSTDQDLKTSSTRQSQYVAKSVTAEASDVPDARPIFWHILPSGNRGFTSHGEVVLGRVRRNAFPEAQA